MLTETFISYDPTDQIIPDFKSYYAEATKTQGRPSGGLAILVSPLLTPTRIVLKTEYLLAVEVPGTTYIAAYYSPNTPVAEIVTDINEATLKISTKTVVLYGDFNCRIDSDQSRGADLTDALLSMNLHLINDTAEMIYVASSGQSAIDLVYVTDDILTNARLRVDPTVGRKHQRVIVTTTETDARIHTGKKSRPRAIRRLDSQNLAKQLKRSEMTSRASENSEPATENPYAQLMKIIECSAQASRTSKAPCNKPWFDRECRDLKKLALADLGTEGYGRSRKQYKTTVRRNARRTNSRGLNRRSKRARPDHGYCYRRERHQACRKWK